MKERLTLFELNSMVSDAVRDMMPSACWVEAELMEIRESRGHCYMELVQKDVLSTTPVARASAKCWRTKWASVGRKFFSSTGGYPEKGMKLLLSVKPEFHAAYGFSLIVDDIDPTYTLGDMARRRQEIIDTLKQEGVFDLQRELTLPLFCQRIAVISSQTAAGYGDFQDQLLGNEAGYDFRPTLFPAVMQGEAVAASIMSCLDEIYSREGEFDCVVIIRGGGATSDMSGFDSLELAESVANFPLPVITGIGHDRDECVLDLISFMKVKTPTAAAAFLIENLSMVDSRIREAGDTIRLCVEDYVAEQGALLDRLALKIRSSSRLYCSKKENEIEVLHMRLKMAAGSLVLRERHRLELMEQRVKSLDPALLLGRGYTMTLLDGRVITEPALLKAGQEIETVFEKGKVKSVVK